MVSSIYKNMLAVCRSSQNQSIKTLLRDHYNFWFAEDLPPFSFTSPNDKVIIFYPNMITANTEDIVPLEDHITFTPTEIADGALQFLADNTMIKIIGCKFKTNELMKSSLSLFREYLMKGVKNLNLIDYNQYKFAIFWDEKLLNGEVLPIIKESGLLTNNNNFSHVFSVEELQGGPPPKYVPEVNFGLNTLGQSTPSIFGTQSSTNPTQSLFSNQSTTPSPFGASTTNPSPFGTQSNNVFSNGATQKNNQFGFNNNSFSTFGTQQNNNVFGKKPTKSGSNWWK